MDRELSHAQSVTITHVPSGTRIGVQVVVAHSFWRRFKGLMGTVELSPGHGMLFPHTNSVHMFFMRYPLCVLYLTQDFIVLRRVVLRPWRIGPVVRRAYWVLEMPASVASQISAGDSLDVKIVAR